jgi:hypothetical protein
LSETIAAALYLISENRKTDEVMVKLTPSEIARVIDIVKCWLDCFPPGALAALNRCPSWARTADTSSIAPKTAAAPLGPQGISDRVLEAVGQTDRHRFVPGRSCSVAYMDGPVRIGQGQTISQPFIVALMTDLAAVKVDDTVLEVGTGSGYQAAVLARLVRKVCTVEIIPLLAKAAANVLKELGYDNVSVKVGDGLSGMVGMRSLPTP